MDSQDDSGKKEGWKLDRRVSVANLLTVFSALSAVLIFTATVDKRISLLEYAQAAGAREMADYKNSVRSELSAISAKLDRLMERMPPKGASR